jgi:hypothetical protein
MLSMARTGRGIILNSAHANVSLHLPSKYIVEAAECARRIKDVLGPNSDIKVLLYTDEAIWIYMNDVTRCNVTTHEVCQHYRELGGHRLFDIVKFYDHLVFPTLTDSKPHFQGFATRYRLMRAVGWLHSPFEKSMFFDSDVYVCPGFERMFDTYLDAKHLIAASVATGDFGNTNGNSKPLREGIPAKEYSRYPERNIGVMVAQTSHPKIIELLALYRDTFVRHASDPNVDTHGDQASMREALFTMRVWIHDRIIPLDIGCRRTLGCDDGCLTVHRHHDQEKSGDDVHRYANLKGHHH